jgi:putative transposase
VRTRTALGRQWVAEGVARPAEIARALVVSRQSLYIVPKRPDPPPVGPPPRQEPPPLPLDWQTCELHPEALDFETALHVLARRHPAAGYRKLCSRIRKKGWPVNRKRVARLLRLWGFTRKRKRPHPKAQGRPFDVTAPNQLWQTDLTAVWCGEDGWAYFTAVIDCFDRSILGWCFTRRCRALDVEAAMAMAWSTAFPYGIESIDGEIAVVLRHDNGTQFTANRYRELAETLGIKLSRTAYRHPDGNAFIERLYRTLKEECVWPNDFDSFEEALAAITAWVLDYNTERPHDSLGKDTTPAEARAAALSTHNLAA